MSKFESTITIVRTESPPSRIKGYKCEICDAEDHNKLGAQWHYVERHLSTRRIEYEDYTLCLFGSRDDVLEYCDFFGFETYPDWDSGWYVHSTSVESFYPFEEFLEIKEEEILDLQGRLKQFKEIVKTG